jgi:uncharacterized protein YjiS (DUF1127 family)
MIKSQCIKGRSWPTHLFEQKCTSWSKRIIRGVSSPSPTRVRAALREWRRRRNGRLELARLDERMLRDIGLTRFDAEYEINKPFWRE